MRRKQVSLISITYLVSNMLVLVELVLIFGVSNEALTNCAEQCPTPYSNGAAAFLLVFAVFHLIPTHLYLYIFYIIPRRFNATSDEDLGLVNDTNQLNQPLLEENFNIVDDDVNWGKDSYRERLSVSNRAHETTEQDAEMSSVSAFSGRLSSKKRRKIDSRSSFKRANRSSSRGARGRDAAATGINASIVEIPESPAIPVFDLDESFSRKESNNYD